MKRKIEEEYKWEFPSKGVLVVGKIEDKEGFCLENKGKVFELLKKDERIKVFG